MKHVLLLVTLLVALPAWSQKGVFLTGEAFQRQAFPAGEPALQTLWLTGELRAKAEAVLNHSFAGLRVRYWAHEGRTAWVFDEIGKELPITIGVVVEGDVIEDVAILEFRESRGSEVRFPFFTRQFEKLGLLKKGDRLGLSGHVDGVTGATLSVRAVKKVATLALLFHRQTPQGKAILAGPVTP